MSQVKENRKSFTALEVKKTDLPLNKEDIKLILDKISIQRVTLMEVSSDRPKVLLIEYNSLPDYLTNEIPSVDERN